MHPDSPGGADRERAAPSESRAERLLRPAVSCPRCGSRPALRVTEAAAHAMAGHGPAERLGTYQCQRRGCGTVYDLTAAALQRAS